MEWDWRTRAIACFISMERRSGWRSGTVRTVVDWSTSPCPSATRVKSLRTRRGRMIRTLIVDDEPLSRQRIRDLLADEPDFTLAGECGDGIEAVATLEKEPCDLVFLDVEMP